MTHHSPPTVLSVYLFLFNRSRSSSSANSRAIVTFGGSSYTWLTLENLFVLCIGKHCSCINTVPAEVL